jgi:hypothetical protein
VFSFSFDFRNFLLPHTPSFFFNGPVHSKGYYLISMCFCISCSFSCFWFLVLFYYILIKYRIFQCSCFMKLGVPTFSSASVFPIIISPCWIIPFNNMKWPSLSLRNNFGLKSAESDISTLAYFQAPFSWYVFPSFHFTLVFVFANKVCFL